MKKMFILAAALLGTVMIMVAANFRPFPRLLNETERERCSGYTIVAFDKGVDCYGDTIQLIRKNGFAQRVSR